MREKEIKLFQAITEIDDRLIEEALTPASVRKPRAHTTSWFIAAALCLLMTVGFIAFPRNEADAPLPENVTAFAAKDESTEKAGAPSSPFPAEQETTPSLLRDYAPVKFSSLSLPESRIEEGLVDSWQALSVDYLPFDESMLSECCGILEGTITRIHSKHYIYRYYNEKFGSRDFYNGWSDTVVYELSIRKVWYGDFEEGSTILIEDDFLFPDSFFSLMEGRTYLLPVYEYGDTARTFITGELAEGELRRDTVYSNLYPFHPQILLTGEGDYIVTTDWESLTADPCCVIQMDEELEYDGYFSDKLRLIYAEDFPERMRSLIQERLS